MGVSILGVPQHDFRLKDGVVYAMIDDGGITSAAISLSEMAREGGFDVTVVTWRPGERGNIEETLASLTLAGYGGVIGIVPSTPPATEYALLSMLLDVGNEASSIRGTTSILVLGLDAIPLRRRIIISALSSCGFVPISYKPHFIDDAGRRLDGPTRAMAALAASGALPHLEEEATEAMAEKYVDIGVANRQVGF